MCPFNLLSINFFLFVIVIKKQTNIVFNLIVINVMKGVSLSTHLKVVFYMKR